MRHSERKQLNLPALGLRRLNAGRQLNAVAVAAGWHNDDGGEFLDNYLRVTRRAKAVVLKVFGG